MKESDVATAHRFVPLDESPRRFGSAPARASECRGLPPPMPWVSSKPESVAEQDMNGCQGKLQAICQLRARGMIRGLGQPGWIHAEALLTGSLE